MILIVALGNPGKKFQKTPHNLGFRVVEEFYRKNREVYFFSNFRSRKKLSSLISEGKFNDQKIILAKPQTFMNLSGKSVKKLVQYYFLKKGDKIAMAEITPFLKNLWVIHDEIDLPLGKMRISISRGAAGHKGVESIIKELKTKKFVRFRIGIQPKTGKPKNIEKFVLEKFNREEEKVVKEVIKKTSQAVEFSLKEGVEKAMNKFNI